MKNQKNEMIAYFDRRANNGVVEGINQKIKLIKRKADFFLQLKPEERSEILLLVAVVTIIEL